MKWFDKLKEIPSNIKYVITVISVLRVKMKEQGFSDSDMIKLFTAINETAKTISEKEQ